MIGHYFFPKCSKSLPLKHSSGFVVNWKGSSGKREFTNVANIYYPFKFVKILQSSFYHRYCLCVCIYDAAAMWKKWEHILHFMLYGKDSNIDWENIETHKWNNETGSPKDHTLVTSFWHFLLIRLIHGSTFTTVQYINNFLILTLKSWLWLISGATYTRVYTMR